MLHCWTLLWLTVTARTEDNKQDRLQQLADSSGLARFTDIAEYRELVLKTPKTYDVFVMFTSDPKFCRVCRAYERVFNHVAYSYKKHAHATDVRFALIDLTSMPAAVQLHGIKQMPLIVHVEKQTTLVKKKSGELSFREKDQFPIAKLDPPASEMLDWANGRVSKTVKLYFTLFDRVQHVFFIALVLIGLGTTAVGLLIQCRKRRWLVMTLPVVIQLVASSGIFFNLLNGMQIFGPDGSWILRSARGQYLAEGLSMSGLMVGGGLCLLLATRLPWVVTDEFRTRHAGVVAASMTSLTAVAVAAVMIMLQVYRLKTGWYQDPPFFPPDWYKRGPVRVDQGNSF
jgi:hypothetical protein